MTVADGAVIGTTKVLDHGPAQPRWNVVILGDGYRAVELPTYHADVARFIARLYGTSPFDELWGAINIYRVDVRSTESGADNPAACADGSVGAGTTAATYFDSTFCFGGASRRILYGNVATALATSLAAVPQRHLTLVIVNSPSYGGGGGAVAWFSTHPDSAEIGLHELAHTYFGLADEYGGATVPFAGPEPPEPNVTRDTNRATIRWRTAILPGTPVPTMANPNCAVEDQRPSSVQVGAVGLFEGGGRVNCGLYRSEHQCRMRTLGQPFCGVCQQRIRTQLAQFGGNVAWQLTGNSGTQPATDFIGTIDNQSVAIRTNASERLRVSANGNVGIGTANPGAGLEIEKGATNDVALQVSSAGLGWGSGIRFRNNVQPPRGGRTYGIYAGFGNFHFADVDNAVDRLLIHSSGRIGMGTGTPQAGLEIDKGATNEVALQLSSSGLGWGSGIRFHNRPAAGGGKTYGIYSGFGQFHFVDVDSQVDRLVIDPSGRVGIGTGQPTSRLFVDETGPIATPAITGVQATGGTGVQGESGGSGVGLPAVRGVVSHRGVGIQGQTPQTTVTSFGVVGMIGSGGPPPALLDGGVGVLGSGSCGVIGRTSGQHPVQHGVEGHKKVGGDGAAVFASQEGTGVGVYAEAASGLAGQFLGNIAVSGTVTAGSKPFRIDHPLDPANRFLNHWSIESPDMMTVQSGSVVTDANGEAVITLPEYVHALSRDFRYQLTPVGRFAQVMVEREIEDNQFVIRTDQPNVKVYWQVSGSRQDPFAQAHRRDVEEEKSESERGRYLHPELHASPSEPELPTPIGYMPGRLVDVDG